MKIILLVVFLFVLAFVFYNFWFVPKKVNQCSTKCRFTTPVTCDGPGCAGSYMACVDECTGLTGSTFNYRHCLSEGGEISCLGDVLKSLLLKILNLFL